MEDDKKKKKDKNILIWNELLSQRRCIFKARVCLALGQRFGTIVLLPVAKVKIGFIFKNLFPHLFIYLFISV